MAIKNEPLFPGTYTLQQDTPMGSHRYRRSVSGSAKERRAQVRRWKAEGWRVFQRWAQIDTNHPLAVGPVTINTFEKEL